jgi:hypothetical protein
MFEFFRYWGECLLRAFELGHGSIDLLEGVCILVWWYGHHKKHKNKEMEAREELITKFGKWVFIFLFITGTFIIAPYQVYRDSAEAKVKAEKALDDKAPKLNGFINQTLLLDELAKTNSLIFLQATILNSGGSPSFADNFKLKVISQNKTLTNAEIIDFADGYTNVVVSAGKSYLLALKRSALIAEKTIKAIQPGEPQRGWIAFRLHGISPQNIQRTNIVLSFYDSNDNEIVVTNGFWRAKPIHEMKALETTLTLPGSESIMSPLPTEAQSSTGWLPPELPPGCSNVIVFFGASGMVYSRFMAEISHDQGTKFAIKAVPDFFLTGIENVTNYSPRQRDIWLKYSTALTIGGKTFPYPVQPIIISNRLYVEVEIPFSNEKHKLVMSDSFDAMLPIPRLWDRNYSTNYEANRGMYYYEVVNELTNPVLQVAYYAPNEVHINGIFQVDSDSILAAFGQQPQLLTLKLDDQCQTNGLITASLQAENFHETLLIHSNETIASFGQRLTNEFFRPIFKYQRPVFKYPSNRNLGAFADWLVETNNSITNTLDRPR